MAPAGWITARAGLGTRRWPVGEPGPGRVELFAGPLDGLHLDVSSLSPAETVQGVALDAGSGCTYPGGFSVYRRTSPDSDRMHWEGDFAP